MNLNKPFFIKSDYEQDRVIVINDIFSDYTNPNIEDSGFFISVGGDGTLLKDIHTYSKFNKPFYGINAGTLGFLMNDYPSSGQINKEKLISGDVSDYTLITFKTIKCTIQTEDETLIYEAFNEIMVGGDMNAWIHFNVEERDEMIGEFSGGGIIISTPQGSTGINKNNNGTILPLTENLWSITGDKCNRNVDYVITPREIKITYTSRYNVNCWVDGRFKIIQNPISVKVEQGGDVSLLFKNINEFIKRRRL